MDYGDESTGNEYPELNEIQALRLLRWRVRDIMIARLRPLGVAATALAVGLTVAHAQTQSLVGIVQATDSTPVRHEKVMIEPNLGPFETTDSGRFQFPLDKSLQVGGEATFSILPSTGNRWVVVKPCDHRLGRIYALPAVGGAPLEIIVARWGSRDLSRSLPECMIEGYASRFRPKSGAERHTSALQNERTDQVAGQIEGEYSPRSNLKVKKPGDFSLLETAYHSFGPAASDSPVQVDPQLDEFLAGKAMELGLSATDLRKAIDSWAASSPDLYEKGLAAFSRGHYAEASREITASIQSATGDVLKRYVPLARAEYEQAHYAAAEVALRKVLGVHGNDTLALNDLAVVLAAQTNYSGAEPLYKRALAIDEKTLGPDQSQIASDLNNLGELYRVQGKYGEAEPLLKRALAIDEQALGPDNPELADILNNLALLYEDQGKYREAELLYQRALAIDEKALGPDHPMVATIVNNLAALSRDQGKYGDAEQLYNWALAADEKGLGPDHPDLARDLNNLAELYYEQGKYREAEPLYQRAFAIEEKILGPDHPDVAASLSNLALLYDAQRKYKEAEPLYQRALAIDEKALGPDHPEVATALNGLAVLYYRQAKYAEAEPLYQRALAIDEKALGPDHRNVARDLNNLAALYYRQGRYAEAEPLYQRALAIDEKALGPNHPDLATRLNNLAELYRDEGKYAEAEPLYKRALAIDEKKLGPDHPSVATIAENLADALRELGRDAEAKKYEKQAAKIRGKER